MARMLHTIALVLLWSALVVWTGAALIGLVARAAGRPLDLEAEGRALAFAAGAACGLVWLG